MRLPPSPDEGRSQENVTKSESEGRLLARSRDASLGDDEWESGHGPSGVWPSDIQLYIIPKRLKEVIFRGEDTDQQLEVSGDPSGNPTRKQSTRMDVILY